MDKGIDEASFVLGELKGRLTQIEKTTNAMFDKLDKIDRSITHIKVKNAGQAATITVIVYAVATWFKDVFKGGA